MEVFFILLIFNLLKELKIKVLQEEKDNIVKLNLLYQLINIIIIIWKYIFYEFNCYKNCLIKIILNYMKFSHIKLLI